MFSKKRNFADVKQTNMFLTKSISKFGEYLCLMGRVMSLPERWRMFFKQYIKRLT